MTNAPRGWVELRVLRSKDGHSLSSLARAAVDDDGKPMSLGYLSDLEAGKRRPNPRVIARLAKALRCPKSMLEPRYDSEDAA
jgi:transcriptional regulator with XRE-family HTH domain